MPGGKKWSDSSIDQATEIAATDQFLIIQASTSESKRITQEVTLGYKVYAALLNQSSTNAPVATILKNTIGAVVWSRANQGLYVATLSGAFPLVKTFVLIGSINAGRGGVSQATTANTVEVITYDMTSPFNAQDAYLVNTSIEIRVYL
jgi:hypothetical protein